MNLAYVTTYDARSLQGANEWSGTGYYIAEALKNQALELEYLGPLKTSIELKLVRKLKRHYYEQVLGKNYQKDSDPSMLKSYANQLARKLKSTKADVVFSATVDPISYLECSQPTAFWADGTFAVIQNFYPQYSNLCDSVIKDWHKMEQLALQKCSLAIYSSDWAAQSAIQDYGADPDKVKVVPFGSNTESPFTSDTIQAAIQPRSSDCCQLLFLAVDWVRKGGNTAYEVAKTLNEMGLKTELTIVGCHPQIEGPLPDFVKALGFISKSTDQGKKQIQDLILASHFLILPTLADCTPIVLCEANALGVPCLSTTVGGIPTMIRNHANGQLFDPKADVTEYCRYIYQIFSNYSEYQDLARYAFHEYQSRLNWKTAGQTVKQLLTDIVL
jgi:glycosyltransferase involved in cell wall biosynthesis